MSAASMLANRGFAVFPLRPDDKRPAVDRWEQRAIADPERVYVYWPSERHNVGVACGPSRLVVVDLDTPKPDKPMPEEWQLPGIVTGADVFAQICEWAGMDWPSTYTVFTPSGGMHLYFRAPEGSCYRNTAGRIGPLIDTRANGGYVVGAGSVIGGKAYEVTDPQDPQPLPAWIARLLEPQPELRNGITQFAPHGGAPKRLEGLMRTVANAKPGSRNETLFWAASRAAEAVSEGDLAEHDATVQLLGAAAACGLPEPEAMRTIASAMKGTR